MPAADEEAEESREKSFVQYNRYRKLIDEDAKADAEADCQPHCSKRMKPGTSAARKSKGKNGSPKQPAPSTTTEAPKACGICRQSLDDKSLKVYSGHPDNAVDEYMALIDDNLCLFRGNEEEVEESDLRAVNKITSYRYVPKFTSSHNYICIYTRAECTILLTVIFSIHCRNGHLCSLESGLIEQEVHIYISGFIKPIYSDDPSTENSVPTKDIGPIVEWYTTGFDGGNEPIIALSTALGEYYLMRPSDEYASFMTFVRTRAFIIKIIIEVLRDAPCSEYEDLLNKFEVCNSTV